MKKIYILLVAACVFLFSLTTSVDAGVNQWTALGPYGGDIFSLTVDPVTPSTIYAVTMHGLFKSTDSGANWTAIDTGGLIKGWLVNLIIDPLTPSTLYASSIWGIYKSTDSGAHWDTSNTGLPANSGASFTISIDPITTSTLYAGTYRDGVYKSTDSGANWAISNTGFPADTWIGQVAIDPVTTSTLYVGTNKGAYKSTDSGANWAISNTGLPANSFIGQVAIDPVTTSTLYAGINKGVYKSTDSGANWAISNTGLPATYFSQSRITIDPVTTSTLYIETDYGVYKSTDSGANWAPAKSGMENRIVTAFALDPASPSTLYAGTFMSITVGSGNDGVFKSTDSGANWTASNNGMNSLYANMLAIDPSTPSTIYAGNFGTHYKSTDSGANWTAIDTGLVNSPLVSLAIDPATPSTLYGGIANWYPGIARGIYKSTDSGANWAISNTGLPANSIIGQVAIDPGNTSTLYALTGILDMSSTYIGVYKSTDSGANWAISNTGLPVEQTNIIAIDPLTTSTLYAGTQGAGVYKSVNSGANWAAVNTGLTNTTIRALAIDPVDPDIIYAGTAQYGFEAPPGEGIFKSVNGGSSWSVMNTGLSHHDVHAIAVDPSDTSRLYAGLSANWYYYLAGDSTGPGVYNSTDSGASWAAMNTGLDVPYVYSLALAPDDPQLIYAGTSRGVYTIQLGATPALSVSPSPYGFGNIQTGTSSTATVFTLANDGGIGLNVSDITLSGTDAAIFTLNLNGGTSPCGSVTPVISSGSNCTLSVTFSPQAVGAKAATLNVSSDDPNAGLISVSLTGAGTAPPAPDILVSPASLGFGSQNTGTSSTAETVTINNNGNADLNVSDITLAGTDTTQFTLDLGGGASPCGNAVPIIASGGSCTVTVDFSPLTTGAKTATLKIFSDDPNAGLVSVSLTGTGTVPPAPDILVSPASLGFGDQRTGTASTVQFVTINNNGNADLSVSDISLAGTDVNQFILDLGDGTSPCGSATPVITSGASCTISVIFSPLTVGAKTATLNISSDDPDTGLVSLTLTGTGVEPNILVSPASLSFGNQRTGTTSTPKVVTINNNGNTDLSVSAISLFGLDAAIFTLNLNGGTSPCASASPVITSGASCTVTVSFGPLTTGAKTAALNIYSDDPDTGLVSLALTGTGTAPNILVPLSSLGFGNVRTSSTPSEYITLTNNGTADLNVSSVTLVGVDTANFSFAPPAPVIAPGGYGVIEVRFFPMTTGAKTATLNIYSDDPDTGLVSVSLTGTGIEPNILVSPASLNFGSQGAGTSSTPQVITLTNNGTAALTVLMSMPAGTDSADFTIDFKGGPNPCDPVTSPFMPMDLTPGASCTLAVAFSPLTVGAKTATLDISSDDPDTGLVSVPLTGTGNEPDILVSPASLDFGSQKKKTTSIPEAVTLTNNGNAALNVSDITLAGTDTADFTLNLKGGIFSCGNAAPVIASGASCTVTVAFSPLSTGDKSAALQIISDDPDTGLVSVPLTGRGKNAINFYGSGGGGGPDCGIVRAYGDPEAPQVNVLREFRDTYLMPYETGRAFVRFYYAHSPEAAAYMAEHSTARLAARVALAPVVLTVQRPMLAVLCLLGCSITLGLRRKGITFYLRAYREIAGFRQAARVFIHLHLYPYVTRVNARDAVRV